MDGRRKEREQVVSSRLVSAMRCNAMGAMRCFGSPRHTGAPTRLLQNFQRCQDMRVCLHNPSAALLGPSASIIRLRPKLPVHLRPIHPHEPNYQSEVFHNGRRRKDPVSSARIARHSAFSDGQYAGTQSTSGRPPAAGTLNPPTGRQTP